MWLIGGSKTKFHPIDGGQRAERFCEECQAETTFRECLVKDTIQAFFVDLLDTEQRRMVCLRCGDDHDVEEFLSSLPRSSTSSAVSRSKASKASAWLSERKSARRARREERALDQELEALKRKLSKG